MGQLYSLGKVHEWCLISCGLLRDELLLIWSEIKFLPVGPRIPWHALAITHNTLASSFAQARTAQSLFVFLLKKNSNSLVKYEVFYCNQIEQTLAMNIQTRSWKSGHKHRLCTFTVCFQCNTHKYLLLFHRVNIQLSHTKTEGQQQRR